jgi:hypothetical protein
MVRWVLTRERRGSAILVACMGGVWELEAICLKAGYLDRNELKSGYEKSSII